jgi:glycosyltransferase involved in cell wall biosynthesis
VRIFVNQVPSAQSDDGAASAAVVLPAWNEERHVAEAVRFTLAVDVRRVIIVNDCSTDGTADIVDALAAADPRVTALHHAENQGKQAAVKTGLNAALDFADCRSFVTLDADMQMDPALLPKLCPWIGAYDVVIGARTHEQMPRRRRAANRLANLPYRMLAAVRINDIQSGYRVYSRRTAACLAAKLNPWGGYKFEHTALLLLAKAAARGHHNLRIAEVAIPCAYGEAESGIRFMDNLQLTWASVANAIRLARLQKPDTPTD